MQIGVIGFGRVITGKRCAGCLVTMFDEVLSESVQLSQPRDTRHRPRQIQLSRRPAARCRTPARAP